MVLGIESEAVVRVVFKRFGRFRSGRIDRVRAGDSNGFHSNVGYETTSFRTETLVSSRDRIEQKHLFVMMFANSANFADAAADATGGSAASQSREATDQEAIAAPFDPIRNERVEPNGEQDEVFDGT